jgi:hypothetical protein
MLIFIIILIGILFIMCIPHIFTTYTNMDYVKHLENMGVYVDENGKEM